MAKTVLLPQTTFTAEDIDQGLCQYDIDDLLINADKITVVFDGVKYENLPVTIEQLTERIDYHYGGVGEGGFDFSVYPFAIQSSDYTQGGGEE